MNPEQYKLIQFHPSYTYEDFVRGITAKSINGQVEYKTENKVLIDFAEKAAKNLEEDTDDERKNYVLVIDEINRANLPSVLGELIYALEYRGDQVESMYSIDGNSTIVLPENLYIIGTMNTADRSVGSIDYAIKRRFSFVSILPDETPIRNEKAKKLFVEISKLFVEEKEGKKINSKFLAPDFDYKDVQLGHSYFLAEEVEELKVNLKYEILPILNEYIRDGLLLETAKDYIEQNISNID